jgi:hypothetical protein
MPIDPGNISLYRIIAVQNLEQDLKKGIYAKSSAPKDDKREIIGSKEIISARDQRPVKCYSGLVVNDFVPFYFSVRTPMLYNIVTGMGVTQKPQSDIIYLHCKLEDLATKKFKWCFTEGNAADKITKFFSDLKHLDQVDWNSIKTTDFRTFNADGDEDRIRKKHAEFLVKDHVPADKITGIAVLSATVKEKLKLLFQSVN